MNSFADMLKRSTAMPEAIRLKTLADFEARQAMTPEERAEADRQQAEAQRARDRERQLTQRAAFIESACGLSPDQRRHVFKVKAPGDTTFLFGGSLTEKEKQAEVVREVRAWAEQFPKVKRGLYLWGRKENGVGCGKDFLLHAIGNRLIERELPLRWFYAYSLDIRARLFKGEWSEVEDWLLSLDLLIIGDIHKLWAAEDGVRRFATRLINQAGEHKGHPMLCATGNYPISDYDETYGRDIGSRMEGAMDAYELVGPDRRRAR